MSAVPQRVVIITRATWFEQLIRQHGTRQQAEFFLAAREQSIDAVEEQHRQFETALKSVVTAIPAKWRSSRVDRNDLDRFLFEPNDIVIVIGQDGLVANVAKYLDRQPVIGVNPSPAYYDGVLVRHAPHEVQAMLEPMSMGDVPLMERTKVLARLDDGQTLSALNELFIGQATHQSARYEIDVDSASEFQSSSGVIVATGTGATGWASSIHLQSHCELILPTPCERRLVHFTREAWPSMTTGTSLTAGELWEDSSLTLTSRMERNGVIFGDGIETDRLAFNWGSVLRVSIAETGLFVPVLNSDDSDILETTDTELAESAV